MINTLRFWFYYMALCLFFFQSTRLLFVLYYAENLQSISGWSQKAKIFPQGLLLDLSTTGYIMLIVSAILLVQTFFSNNWSKRLLRHFTQVLFLILTILSVADLFLYQHWNFRLDHTAFQYLGNPTEVLNFVSVMQLLLGLGLTGLIYWLFIKIYRIWLEPKLEAPSPKGIQAAVMILVLGISLVFPIRGGIGLTPINLSHVFFSNNVFANQATINIPWNLVYSWSEKQKREERYQYMSEEQAANAFRKFYPPDSSFTPLLNTTRPDVIMVILESFTANLIDYQLDGKYVTPELNRLCQEGIYFSNCFASGSRTDKGLVATLSGYPAMPQSAIINYQEKVQQLPSLIRDLKTVGYTTEFYYGGDINFANQKSYLLLSGIDKIIDKEAFSADIHDAKWGVHDHLVFERLLENLPQSQSPFFHTLLSLSSHEPFEVPMETVFPDKGFDYPFANSAHYTDQALGAFVQQLKASEHWDNLVLILVADHGTVHIGNNKHYSRSKFKIPLVWLGGALKNDSIDIKKYVSQTDIAASLLKQMQLPTEAYTFSKDIFSRQSESFAYYSFNNGAGFVSDSLATIYNNRNQRYIYRTGSDQNFPEAPEQVYLQVLSKDYFEK